MFSSSEVAENPTRLESYQSPARDRVNEVSAMCKALLLARYSRVAGGFALYWLVLVSCKQKRRQMMKELCVSVEEFQCWKDVTMGGRQLV